MRIRRALVPRVLCALALLLVPAFHAAPVAAQTVALDELVVADPQPTGIHPPDDSGRLIILSKDGKLQVFDGAQILAQPFLDLTPIVNSSGVERGLHGLAFHPDYADNGLFYVMYTDLDSDSTLASFEVTEDPNVADPMSREIVLVIDQPDQYHNASQLAFGPDGYLYVGSGDGGFVGDPFGNAQDLSTHLGKILRLDVDGGVPYGIPPDNPFVDTPGALPEIWAYGVRNPWRFSFDRATGDLYMGDVGQSDWEEVNFQPADSTGGENYGWNRMEGFHCYDPPTDCFDPSFTLPILEYEHQFFGGECAVTGGFVYRGERFPRFQGLYFYADWCSGVIWTARQEGADWVNVEVLDSSLNPTTFGQDAAGELLIGDDGSGTIYRIVDPIPFCDLAMSQDVYTEGEVVTAENVRLVNLGESDAPLRFQVGVVPPSAPPRRLVDVGDDGSFVLPAGSEDDRGPVELFTVGAGTPTGSYSLRCRLSVPGGGPTVALDEAVFTVE